MSQSVIDERPQPSREALLIAAERLFSERGYEAVSTRELADLAGVNLGSIQYHFGSKAKLFVETIHRMMERESNWSRAQDLLQQYQNESVEGGATAIAHFIFFFLDHLLQPCGPQACRLMFREILGDPSRNSDVIEPLITSVVEHCAGPTETHLCSMIEACNPRFTTEDSRKASASIIGQCTYYVANKPFVERLWGTPIDSSPHLESIAEHISHFSLRALGVEEEIRIAAVRRAIESFAQFKSLRESSAPLSISSPAQSNRSSL